MSNNSLVPVPSEPTVSPQIASSNPFDHSHLLNKLKDTIEHIIQLCEDTENSRDAAEDELMSIAEELNNVSDYYEGSLAFCKLGGLKSIKAAVAYSSDAVKATFLDVLATISQNNEEVQNFVYKNSNFVQDFSTTLKKENLANIYRGKLIYALSSLIRGNVEGKRLFFDDSNGIETLKESFNHAYNEEDSRSAGRIAIVAFHFFQDNSEDQTRQNNLKNLVLNFHEKMALQHSTYETQLDYIKDIHL